MLLLSDSPGTIALPTSEVGRFALFTITLACTMQPPETNLATMASASIVENLNQAIRQLRDIDEWVWIIGDDHTWQKDALMNMLSILDDNPEVDVLVPLVTKRNPPWHLVLFHETDDFDEAGCREWLSLKWSEIPETGVFPVDASGNAGMLIRRKVLDEIGDPWFENTGGFVMNEDVNFCERIRRAGFGLYATADVTLGHIGLFNVRPMYHEGRWGALTEFSTPEEQFKHIFMPTLDENEPVRTGR